MCPGAPRLASPNNAAEALELVDLATDTRLLGPLMFAVDLGQLDLPHEAVQLLVERHRAAQLWCLHLEARLLEICEWFAAAGGIEFLVLKGSAVAHLDEVVPELRSFADIDILVVDHQIDRAVTTLSQHGATRPWAEVRPRYDRRYAKSVTMTCPDGVEVDVHRALCDGVHGLRIPVDRLFAQSESLTLGRMSLTVLSPVHRALHGAYHAILGSPLPSLVSLRDLAGYLSDPSLSPEIVVPEAARWGGEAVLAAAVRTTVAELNIDPPQWREWAERTGTPRRERRIIERQRIGGSGFGLARVDMLAEMSGMRERAGFLAAVVWPSSAHLRSRGLRRRDRFTMRRRPATRPQG